ncbi:MAG: hypothetical protein ACYC4L_01655 [Chloroflexota bacterium]
MTGASFLAPLLACAPQATSVAPNTTTVVPATSTWVAAAASTLTPPTAVPSLVPSATVVSATPPPPQPAATGVSAASTTGSPAGLPAQLADLPLTQLAPEADAFLATREGKSSLAVVVPSDAAIYTANGDQLMSMASVVKVVVMLAVLDRAQSQERSPTEGELAVLGPMIQLRDNASTTALGNDLRVIVLIPAEM